MEREDFDIRDNQLTSRERDFENALRPLSFEDFSGQDKVVDNLRIFVKAARLRGEALDHVLLQFFINNRSDFCKYFTNFLLYFPFFSYYFNKVTISSISLPPMWISLSLKIIMGILLISYFATRSS